MARIFPVIDVPVASVVKDDAIETVHGWASVQSVQHRTHSVVLELQFRWGHEDNYLYSRNEKVTIKKR